MHQNSETYGIQQLTQAFAPTFPHARILRNAILPMPGFGECPTGEFDAIVVCEAGVFAFEIKGYSRGALEIIKGEDGTRSWLLHKSGATDAQTIPDPVAQSGRKIKFLRESIPAAHLVRGYVYFTSVEISLPPTAPANILVSADLGYLPRLLRTQSRRKKGCMTKETIDAISDAIEQLSSQHTLDEHIRNCRMTQKIQ